jgi:hypothetical protein
MLVLKYGDLKNQELGTAIRKLQDLEARKLPQVTAWSLMKILRWLKSEEKVAQKKLQAIFESFYARNEDGSLVLVNENPTVLPEKQPACTAALEAWGETEMSFDWHKLNGKTLMDNTSLTLEDLAALEALVDLETLQD